MPREDFELCVQPQGPSATIAAVPATFEEPSAGRRASVCLFAHGANFGKDSPWSRAMIDALVACGFGVLSFDYAYRARSERDGCGHAPDPPADLEHVHARALAALEERSAGRRLLLTGKSLGARLATLLAAKGERCHGLALLGYPLHPRGRERLLSEHFAAIAQPALFLQGTRDSLCDLALLSTELGRLGGRATLEAIEGADHGFRRPADEEALPTLVIQDLAQRIDLWEARTWPD